jgi:hypothetical protein
MERDTHNNDKFYNKLRELFQNNINFSYKTTNELFLITSDDSFYRIDLKRDNCLNFILNDDETSFTDESMIVKKLSLKGINDLVYSDGRCIARSPDRVFCWKFKCESDFNIYEIISNEQITDVCCDSRFSYILNIHGEIFAYNGSQLINNVTILSIDSLFSKIPWSTDQRLIQISCCHAYLMALTEDGNVLCFNNLDLQNNHPDINPNIPNFDGAKIKKITCGKSHSLFLSTDGDIHVLIHESFKVTKLEYGYKFLDIASHNDYDISSTESNARIFCLINLDLNFRPFIEETNCKSFGEVYKSKLNVDYELSRVFSRFEDPFFKTEFFKDNFENIERLYVLEKGKFGIVMKAKEKKEGQYFALKKIEFFIENNKEIILEFMNYFLINRITEQGNKFLVQHHDLWFERKSNRSHDLESELKLFIKMELCDETLQSILKDFDNDNLIKIGGLLTPMGYFFASQVFTEILECVEYLHKQNPPIIHRNLTPANILLKKIPSHGHFVKITGFGQITRQKSLEQTNTLDRGTPRYMAPEVRDNKRYNIKADIYSLAIIFDELLDLYRYSKIISLII